MTKLDDRSTAARTAVKQAHRRVLNVGSGPYSPDKLHAVFKPVEWREVRLDIDAETKPDVLGSITNLDQLFEPSSFDAIWSSHVLEHLYAHQVVPALLACRRILNPFGFAVITCPDLEAVASLILKQGLDHNAYRSPAGPIAPLDMIYGHSDSIRKGHYQMAHKTGFTAKRLGEVLLEAGFKTVLVKRGDRLDLWALGLMAKSNMTAIQQELLASGLDLVGERE